MPELPVVFMADDAYAGWAEPFLRSLRDHAPDVPVRCIPYSGQMERIAALAAQYGVRFIEADFAAIDAFAAEFFPGRHRGRNLRKLAAFDQPGAPWLYMDCDQLVTAPLAELLAALPAVPADLVYFATSGDYVFAAKALPEMTARWPRHPLLSTGNYAMLRRCPTSAEAMALIREHRDLYLRARHPAVVDQPVMNLLLRLLDLEVLPLHEAVPAYTGEGFYRDHRITADADGTLWRENQRVLAIHFAGADKTGASPALQPLLRHYGLAA